MTRFARRAGGSVRKKNARVDRIDRRLRTNRAQERRSVIALRQRGGRTLTQVFGRERDGVAFAKARIVPETLIIADEVAHWDLLDDAFSTERINHSDAYSLLDGVYTNGAESYFSRLRCMITGQHHRVGSLSALWLCGSRRVARGSTRAEQWRARLGHSLQRSCRAG